MKKILRAVTAFLSLLMIFPLASCGGESDVTDPETLEESVPVTDEPSSEAETTEQTAEETEELVEPSEWDVIREKANNEGIKILFIGDSLTHYNEMPQIFARLCNAAGKKVHAERQTEGKGQRAKVR